MNRLVRTGAVAAALIASLTLSACGSEPAEFEDSTPPATDTSNQDDDTTDGSAGGDAPEGEEETTAAQSSEIDPSDVVASTTYPLTLLHSIADGVDGTITVGVHELRVVGDTMRLVLYITPEFTAEDDPDQTYNIYTMHGGTLLKPLLNDRDNLKQYVVLSDDDGLWASVNSNGGAEASSGETLVWWGYYTAPQDEISELEVAVFPGADEMTVAVQR